MTPDAATLARIHAAASHERPWTEAEFTDLISARGTLLTGDDRCFLIGRVILDEAEILMLATDPAYRRQGLARAILYAFHMAALDRGATAAFLEVAEDNTAALALYRSAGYRQTGRRPGYYAPRDGKSVAALTMTLPLPPADAAL